MPLFASRMIRSRTASRTTPGFFAARPAPGGLAAGADAARSSRCGCSACRRVLEAANGIPLQAPRHGATPPLSAPADHAEREADALAARALAGIDRAAPDAERATRPAHAGGGGDGRPLDPAVRAFFEPRFGVDLGAVRVHASDQAARSARAFGALAYTIGQDVVFGAGRYTPGTREGDGLIAHELAHVVQQSRPGAQARIARRADPAAVGQMAPSAARANADYVDNGISLITFYAGEQADIHYADGAVLRLGLVPRWIEAPVQSVDYHSARADFAAVENDHGLVTR